MSENPVHIQTVLKKSCLGVTVTFSDVGEELEQLYWLCSSILVSDYMKLPCDYLDRVYNVMIEMYAALRLHIFVREGNIGLPPQDTYKELRNKTLVMELEVC